MLALSKVKVPVIAIIIGEASSGGALALGIANKVWMLENAIYCILSPEGYASILWKDASKAKEAASKMKLTAQDLYDLKVIDKIIQEPKGTQEECFEKVVRALKKELQKTIEELSHKNAQELVQERYLKFRNMGEYSIL